MKTNKCQKAVSSTDFQTIPEPTVSKNQVVNLNFLATIYKAHKGKENIILTNDWCLCNFIQYQWVCNGNIQAAGEIKHKIPRFLIDFNFS